MLPGKTFAPKDVFDIVRRRWWLLTIPPVITLFGALVYSTTIRDVYQSDTLISVVPQHVPDSFVRSTVTLQAQDRLAMIQVQITSRSVLEPIISELDLYPEEREKMPMEDVVQILRDSIQVEIQRQPLVARSSETMAFRVSYTYPDPDLATRVTQRIGSIFVDQNARDRGAMAKGTDDFMQVQLTQALQRLEAQEAQVEAFRRQHGNVLPTQLQSNLQAMQNANMQVQALVEAIARDRDRKMVLERLYQEALTEPTVVPMPAPARESAQGEQGGVPATGTTAQQLVAARAMLAGLERRVTPEHPDIVRIKRMIADLEVKAELEEKAELERRNALKEAAGSPASAPVVVSAAETQRRERTRQMKSELESLDRLTAFKETEERRLRELVAEYQRRIEAVPGIESEWVALTRDYETLEQNYRSLLTKSEASKVSLDLESRQISEHFRIVDPARRPVKPVSPIRYQITGAGLASGLLFGLAVVVLLELKDAAFRSESEVVRLLSLPVLAVVPHVETAGERKRRMQRQWVLAASSVVFVGAAAYVFWMMRLWTVVV